MAKDQYYYYENYPEFKKYAQLYLKRFPKGRFAKDIKGYLIGIEEKEKEAEYEAALLRTLSASSWQLWTLVIIFWFGFTFLGWYLFFRQKKNINLKK